LNSGLRLLKKVEDSEYESKKRNETFMSQRHTKSKKSTITKSDKSRGLENLKGNKVISKDKAISFVSNFFGKDRGSRYERRFKYIKEVLPQDKVIGYITDRGDLADFYYTQYVLSPIILDYYKVEKFKERFRLLYKDKEFKSDLVVGNLYDYDIDSMQRTLKSENLLLVKDYGDGVLYLLKLKRGED
jgi:hypothetical protein